MSDHLVKQLRDLGDRASFEPHMYHTAADRIVVLSAENHLLKTSGIVEVAVRNPNVMEYMRHWEGRAEEAEANLVEAVEALRFYGGVMPVSFSPGQDGGARARATLAELKGKTDE